MKQFLATLVSWGPLGIFILSCLDSAGVPVPAAVDVLLIALAAQDPGRAYLAAFLTVIGSVSGCMFLFFAARKGGRAYLSKNPSTRAAILAGWFERYGVATVFVTALVPIIPTPTKAFVVSSGVFGVRPMVFFLVVLLARVLHYFGIAYLGAQMGDGAVAYLKSHAWHLGAFAIGLMFALFILLKASEKLRLAHKQVAP